jgi:Alpha/beta hydrolase family
MSVEKSAGAVRNKKVLLFVHGAGKTNANYADEPVAAIAKLLGGEPEYVAVYYPDIANLGSPLGVAVFTGNAKPLAIEEPPRVRQFKAAYAEQLKCDLSALQSSDRSVAAAALPGQDLAELLADEINEVAGYLFNPLIYNKIQSRMYLGLNQAAQKGDSIVIASHSLGTVVAFDGLRALGGQFDVSTLVTLGSPLAKLRHLGNRTADLGAITYEHVGEWLNFYDSSDPIADPLGPAFPQPGYRLRDVFVDIASAPFPAHDYFHNDQVLAEIARALR